MGINTGGDAFPMASGGDFCPGMTLRDYFAGQAMLAIIAKNDPKEVPVDDDCATEIAVSIGAYSYADAMIAERNKNGN